MQEAEAKTIESIRQNIIIPVHEVYNSYNNKDTGFIYIVIEFIQGKGLDKAWTSLSRSQKKSIV